MGQFKPMVKMETTEPSVILKLKKGGHVAMHSKSKDGYKPMKKMDGGAMAALAGTPALVGRPAVNAPVASPGRPSMNDRRKAMMMAKMMKQRQAMPSPMMKKGGRADDMDQDKAMVKKAFKQHDMQEHKGGKGTSLKLKKGGMHMMPDGKMMKNSAMKEGGMTMVNKGGKMVPDFAADGMGKMKKGGKMATGGVAMGAAGFAKGGGVKLGNAGGYKNGGKVMSYVDGNVVGTPPGKTNTTTGGVRLGNAGGFKKGGMMDGGMMGGYKKGGSAKKC